MLYIHILVSEWGSFVAVTLYMDDEIYEKRKHFLNRNLLTSNAGRRMNSSNITKLGGCVKPGNAIDPSGEELQLSFKRVRNQLCSAIKNLFQWSWLDDYFSILDDETLQNLLGELKMTSRSQRQQARL